MRVMVVEDDDAHALLIAECLKELGAQIDHVKTQTDAFKSLARGKFDLVVLDMGLPDGSGLEIQKSLKAWLDPPPVLFVTSDDLAEHAVKAMRDGAVDYVVKRPNYLEEMRRAVVRLLEGDESPRGEFIDRERNELLAALGANRWNVSSTARELGMSRGKLRGRMKVLGLD